MPEIYDAEGKLKGYDPKEDEEIDNLEEEDLEGEEEEDLEDLDLEELSEEDEDREEEDDEDREEDDDVDPIDEMDDSDAEREARSQGWVPPEEFRGPKGKAVDAKTFLKRGQEILPIVNSQKKELQRQLEEMRNEITGLTRAHNAALKKQAEKFKEQLLTQRAEAREIADWDTVDDVEEKIKEVDKQIKDLDVEDKAPEAKVPTVDELMAIPEVKDWVSANPWYGKDRRMTRIADAVSNDIRTASPTMTRKEYFEALDAELKAEYPELFAPKTRGKRHSAASSAGRGGDRGRPSGGGRSNKKSFSDLPRDAQRVCAEQVKEGLFKSKQEYVDIYFGQE